MTRERTIHVLIGAFCAIAVVAIVAILGEGEIDETTARLLATVLTVALYVAVGLAPYRLAHSSERWTLFGAIATAICLLAALTAVGLWWSVDNGDGSDDDAWAKAAGCLALFAVVCSHGSLLLTGIERRTEAGRLVRYATLACGLLLVTFLSEGILDEASGDEQLYAVLGIVYLLGAVVSPLLRLGES